MNFQSKSNLLKEVSKLVELELNDSAEVLCSLFVSHLGNTLENKQNVAERVSQVYAEVYELMGDAFYLKKEIKRALFYFQSASQRKRSQQGMKYRTQNPVLTVDDARLRYKECKCTVALKDYLSALKELEGVPAKFRDVKTNVLLGNLYKITNRRKSAIAAYKEALALAPTAIEIIEKLVCLGVDAAEIMTTLDDGFRYKEAAELVADGWLHTLVAGLVNQYKFDNAKSSACFQKLNGIYPKNVYLLSHLASVTFAAEQVDTACTLFRQVRKVDPYVIKDMECFGQALHAKEDSGELSRLADEVLEVAPQRGIGWVLAAMFCSAKGEAESAVEFIDKVCCALVCQNPVYFVSCGSTEFVILLVTFYGVFLCLLCYRQ
jgi:tetratricopeptide (TPR) repeat protein